MFRLSDDIRRLFGALVAVALLIANVGVSHAMPVSGSHEHAVEIASPHEGARHAEDPQVTDCAENAAEQDHGQPAEHGTFGNCCVVACSPTVIVADITDVAAIDFSVMRPGVHADRFSGWNAPDGLFRPPRSRV